MKKKGSTRHLESAPVLVWTHLRPHVQWWHTLGETQAQTTGLHIDYGVHPIPVSALLMSTSIIATSILVQLCFLPVGRTPKPGGFQPDSCVNTTQHKIIYSIIISPSLLETKGPSGITHNHTSETGSRGGSHTFKNPPCYGTNRTYSILPLDFLFVEAHVQHSSQQPWFRCSRKGVPFGKYQQYQGNYRRHRSTECSILRRHEEKERGNGDRIQFLCFTWVWAPRWVGYLGASRPDGRAPTHER